MYSKRLMQEFFLFRLESCVAEFHAYHRILNCGMVMCNVCGLFFTTLFFEEGVNTIHCHFVH